MMSVERQVKRLFSEASDLDTTIRGMTLRPGSYLFDWALALLAWQGIAGSRAIGHLAERNEVEGIIPTFRYLFEIGIDLAYLATCPEGKKEERAAYSVAWEVWQLERQYNQVSEPAPNEAPYEIPTSDKTPEERLEDICEELGAIGVSGQPIRDAFNVIGQKKDNGVLKQHWSGRPTPHVFKKIQESPLPEVPADFEEWAYQLWVLTSTAAHSSPVWARADWTVAPGDTPVLPSYESRVANVEGMARAAAGWLGYFPLWVELARGGSSRR